MCFYNSMSAKATKLAARYGRQSKRGGDRGKDS